MVTGACGMLGTEVCQALQDEHHVVPTDILPGCERMDVADVGSVFDTLNRFRPELVIHCAGMTDVDGCERDPDAAFLINAVGTWNVACACASLNCPIAYISTDYVFDGIKGQSYTEYDRPNPINYYGASKLAGENEVRELCARHYIVRTSWLFAPHGKNFPLSILRASEVNKEVRVVSDQTGSPTYSKDLAHFLATLVASPLYGTYHFANAGSCSWFEFAKGILEKAGRRDVNVVPIRSEEWNTPTRRPAYSVLRRYKLELLGRDSARPWQEAVTEFVSEWTTAKR